jgi:hypothetical protein
MAYSSRRLTRKRSAFSAESMYLLVVLAAAVATAYWAGHSIGMNLSVIQTVASVLGIDETVGTTRHVGYSQAPDDAAAQPTAPYCQLGEQPTFRNGMAALKAQIGEAMGSPVECEHSASVVGDTVQQTTTGLAAYNDITNTETFTDGWHHWALSPNGLVNWEGTSAEPPPQSASASDPAPE